jgi:hypothetical protein
MALAASLDDVAIGDGESCYPFYIKFMLDHSDLLSTPVPIR